MTKSQLLEIVGDNLRQYRLDNSLTQEKLAEKAKISTSFYANLENGKKGMSLLVLRNLANSLNVSTDYLLFGPSEESRFRNIEAILRDKPDELLLSIEKIVHVCCEEFSK